MASVYDIIKGINQAAANAWDGSHDKRFVELSTDKQPENVTRKDA